MADDKINTTMVWLSIPGLGMQFYDEYILLILATSVGTPIKVNMNTADMHLGKFACICVEIDLDQPVVGTLRLWGVWYNIKYEGLHLLCARCGCYGQLSRKCKTTITTPATKETHAATASSLDGVHEKTLESFNHALNEDPMHSEILAPRKGVLSPLNAHGKWLNVEKPVRKQNQNQNPLNRACKI